MWVFKKFIVIIVIYLFWSVFFNLNIGVLGSGPRRQESKTLRGKVPVPKTADNRTSPLWEIEISHQGLVYAINRHSSLVTLHLITKKKKKGKNRI